MIMANYVEHEFRLDISVYPGPSAEMVSKGYKGTVHFHTEMTSSSLQDAVANLIGIYRACKWFSIGGRVYVNGVWQYVCFYTSENGFSHWYQAYVNGLIIA